MGSLNVYENSIEEGDYFKLAKRPLNTKLKGDFYTNFAGMKEYSKDMLHKNIGARPRSYDNHINRVFL